MNTPAASRAATPSDHDVVSEGAEILASLITNIERDGMYSKETTLGFLSQAYYCLRPANPAAQPASPAPLTVPSERIALQNILRHLQTTSYHKGKMVLFEMVYQALEDSCDVRAALASPQVAPADVVSDALDAFERRERGSVQAHVAAKLVAELRAALAAPVQVAPAPVNEFEPRFQSRCEAALPIDLQGLDGRRISGKEHMNLQSVNLAAAPVAPQDDARDAARYRFLRANDGFDEQVAGLNQCHWDKVIDAAMSASTPAAKPTEPTQGEQA